MAKAYEIGTSSIKSVFCLEYLHLFRNHFKNYVEWKCLTETNSDIYSFIYVG